MPSCLGISFYLMLL